VGYCVQGKYTHLALCYVSKLLTKTKPSEVLLKFSYWILKLPCFPNSFYPGLAVRFRAGSKFVLALVFTPIGNCKTVLQQIRKNCIFYGVFWKQIKCQYRCDLDLTPCSFGTEIRKEEPEDLFITVKDIHLRQQVLPKQG